MKTVCPSCTPPPITPSPPPHALPGLAASVRCPQFTRNRSSVRPGSSEIVRAHRRPSPALPAELPQCSPDSARQTGKKIVIPRHFASKYDPTRPGQKTVLDLPRPYRYSTNLKRPNRHADRHEMAVNDRQERRAIREKKLFSGRHLGTYGDIWGHMSPSRAQHRPGTHCRARPAPCRFTRPNMHANRQKMANNDHHIGTVHPREKYFYRSTLTDFGRLWSTFVDPNPPSAGTTQCAATLVPAAPTGTIPCPLK